jgi:hypothetical protein
MVKGKSIVQKYILSWLGLLAIAMVNGAIRDGLYKNHFGELVAHQISCIAGILLFGLFIWFLEKRWPLVSSHQAWIIGFMWLVMTVCFEFFFFHYARGISWNILLFDYRLFEGRLWILVLIWVTVAPRLIWQWKRY